MFAMLVSWLNRVETRLVNGNRRDLPMWSKGRNAPRQQPEYILHIPGGLIGDGSLLLRI